MRSSSARLLVLSSLLLVFAPVMSYSQSARTLSRTLDQLIDESEVIVHGSVVSTRLEPHPQLRNLMSVVVSLKVKETYKGKAQKSLVFRQYVWDAGRGPTSTEYRKGEEVVLLLRPVSEYGLTSPAGLEQGKFNIVLDRNHHLTAVNGRGNAGLLEHFEDRARVRGVAVPQHLSTVIRRHEERSLPLTDLRDAILSFTRSH
jgi:hypothetical protein